MFIFLLRHAVPLMLYTISLGRQGQTAPIGPKQLTNKKKKKQIHSKENMKLRLTINREKN